MRTTKKRTTLLQPAEVSSNAKINLRELDKKYRDLKKAMKKEMYDNRVVIQNNKGSILFR